MKNAGKISVKFSSIFGWYAVLSKAAGHFSTGMHHLRPGFNKAETVAFKNQPASTGYGLPKYESQYVSKVVLTMRVSVFLSVLHLS